MGMKRLGEVLSIFPRPHCEKLPGVDPDCDSTTGRGDRGDNGGEGGLCHVESLWTREGLGAPAIGFLPTISSTCASLLYMAAGFGDKSRCHTAHNDRRVSS